MAIDRIPVSASDFGEIDVTAKVTALRDQDVSMVAITFVDTAGITRVKCVPIGRLEHTASLGVGVSPVFDTFCFDDSMVVGKHLGGPDGDLRLIPDLARLVPLAAQPGWAWAPANKFTQEGPPFAGCQRRFAADQVAAAAEHGLSLRMAFESEWSLGKWPGGLRGSGGSGNAGGSGTAGGSGGTGGSAGASGGAGGSAGEVGFEPAFDGPAYGLIRLDQVAGYAADLVEALSAQGLTVEQFHPEYALAQLELTVQSTDPVGAADDVVLVRDTVRQVSAQYGWRASFAPTVDPNGAGTGAHLHFSVHDADGSTLAGGPGPYGMTEVGAAFLAGVLRELPALCAIGAAHPTSYVRLQPSRWAGVWQCWGHETREAALRFITGVVGTEATAANAEVKCFDATGNPYLVAGAVIAAGLAGVTEKLTLPPEISGDPAGLSGAERAELGISRLPTSLGEAAEAFADSRVLAEAMGEVLHDTVLTMRRSDGERFAETSPDELTALSRWRY